MDKVQVYQMTKGERSVPNQFIIGTSDGLYFQSYSTLIAFKPNPESSEKVKLSRSWDYSRTTVKYLCQFLNVRNKKEIEKRIKSKEYLITDDFKEGVKM